MMNNIKQKNWEIVIGLEIHAQVNSNSKLFSGATNSFGAEPNSQVALFDAAIPGTLPRLNKYAIEQAVKTGLAINAQINKYSVFDRKHYFYPDLPSGYQISQFYYPIVGEGHIIIELKDGTEKTIKIERIHLEQDAGKNIHDLDAKYSYIDLNRAGVPLMEIVSKPDMRSSEEAVAYIKKLQLIMQYIGSCDGNMEKGNLRCDANISVRPMGQVELGTRCEIKNLNSTRNIELAIEYEVARQIEILENGGEIEQQTRLFDADKGETRKLRGKEDSLDYRYFPDPDLLPINLNDNYIDDIAKNLPKLPDQRRIAYADFGLNHEFIKSLIADFQMGSYFEAVLDHQISPILTANWINIEVLSRMNKANIFNFNECPIKPEQLAELLNEINNKNINAKIAKDVLDKMFETGLGAQEIITQYGLAQVTDTGFIEKIVDQVLAENPDQIAKYKAGNEKLFGFFVGQIMKKSEGKANPEQVNEILRGKL